MPKNFARIAPSYATFAACALYRASSDTKWAPSHLSTCTSCGLPTTELLRPLWPQPTYRPPTCRQLAAGPAPRRHCSCLISVQQRYPIRNDGTCQFREFRHEVASPSPDEADARLTGWHGGQDRRCGFVEQLASTVGCWSVATAKTRSWGAAAGFVGRLVQIEL